MASYQIGEKFTHERECDRYRPIYYAGASGDFNPIHIDNDVGEKAGLGGAILQGMCTMGWAVEATVNYLGHPSKLRRFRVRFSKPVMIGDVIRIEGKVTHREGARISGDVSAKNQRGEDVLKGATFEAEI
jgi:3-hydroxybutyryl-CoA dehydratase